MLYKFVINLNIYIPFILQDDGCGINADDLQIVCERHTTSKLSNYDDLSTLNTYGFRGEALASISHCAQLTIKTRTNDSEYAIKQSYHGWCSSLFQIIFIADGHPTGDVSKSAGNIGTTITVSNLFYNMPLRQNGNVYEEQKKIVEVFVYVLYLFNCRCRWCAITH